MGSAFIALRLSHVRCRARHLEIAVPRAAGILNRAFFPVLRELLSRKYREYRSSTRSPTAHNGQDVPNTGESKFARSSLYDRKNQRSSRAFRSGTTLRIRLRTEIGEQRIAVDDRIGQFAGVTQRAAAPSR